MNMMSMSILKCSKYYNYICTEMKAVVTPQLGIEQLCYCFTSTLKHELNVTESWKWGLICAVLCSKAKPLLCWSTAVTPPQGALLGQTRLSIFLHFGKYRQGAQGCSIDLNLMGGSGRLVHWTTTVLPWLIIKQMFLAQLADLHCRLEWGREERERT